MSRNLGIGTDYYSVRPADNEMDAPDDYRCDYCDRLTEKYSDDAIHWDEVCREDCEDYDE